VPQPKPSVDTSIDTSLQLSIADAPTLCIQTRAQLHARAVKYHSYVSDGLTQNLTRVGGRQFLDLAQVEHSTLEGPQGFNALPNRFARFSRAHAPIGRRRRPDPAAPSVELRLERFVDGVIQLFTRLDSPAFLDFVMEYAKQPCADLRASLKAVDRLDERDENILSQIFGLFSRPAHPTRSPIQAASLLLDNRPQRFRIAPAQTGQECSVDLAHEPHHTDRRKLVATSLGLLVMQAR
jgi:hypothetical protein